MVAQDRNLIRPSYNFVTFKINFQNHYITQRRIDQFLFFRSEKYKKQFCEWIFVFFLKIFCSINIFFALIFDPACKWLTIYTMETGLVWPTKEISAHINFIKTKLAKSQSKRYVINGYIILQTDYQITDFQIIYES